jgi:hypothetical protein
MIFLSQPNSRRLRVVSFFGSSFFSEYNVVIIISQTALSEAPRGHVSPPLTSEWNTAFLITLRVIVKKIFTVGLKNFSTSQILIYTHCITYYTTRR